MYQRGREDSALLASLMVQSILEDETNRAFAAAHFEAYGKRQTRISYENQPRQTNVRHRPSSSQGGAYAPPPPPPSPPPVPPSVLPGPPLPRSACHLSMVDTDRMVESRVVTPTLFRRHQALPLRYPHLAVLGSPFVDLFPHAVSVPPALSILLLLSSFYCRPIHGSFVNRLLFASTKAAGKILVGKDC